MLDFTGLRALRSRSLSHSERAVAVIAGIAIAFQPRVAFPIPHSTEFYSSSVLLAQETSESEAFRLLREGFHLSEIGTEESLQQAIETWLPKETNSNQISRKTATRSSR